jgi:hypothetical protein
MDDLTPYLQIRFVQCLLIFGLSYVLYRQLGLAHRTCLLGLGLLAGVISLSLGSLGPSTFSLDRFTDTIFYLIASLLVLAHKERLIIPLMVLAVANRETSVFIPALILAHRGVRSRSAAMTATLAWVVGAATWFGIHSYYGPQPRSEESYWGPDMFLHSLSMPAQVAYFFATVNLMPLLAVMALPHAGSFLRRAFWLIVPLWFAIHVWAARLGEGMLFLAPITIVLVPLLLQGLQHRPKYAPVEWPSAP